MRKASHLGFESPFERAGDGVHVWDNTRARSGRGYLKFVQTTAGTHPTGCYPQSDVDLIGANGVQQDAHGVVSFAMYIQSEGVGGRPSNKMSIFRVRLTDGAHNVGVGMNANGTIFCFANTVGTPDEGAASSVAMPEDPTQWTRIDGRITITAGPVPPGGSNDGLDVTATITKADGTTETVSHGVSGKTIGGFNQINLVSAKFMGRCDDAVYNGTNITYNLNIDDCVLRVESDRGKVDGAHPAGSTGVAMTGDAASYAVGERLQFGHATIYTVTASGLTPALTSSLADNEPVHPVLPLGTSVGLCMPTGQGAIDEWGGDWWEAAKTAFEAFETTRQTVNGAGPRTTFLHETLEKVGPGASTAYAVMVFWFGNADGATAATNGFVYGGNNVAGNGNIFASVPRTNSVLPMPWFCSTAATPPAAFNALEWGVRAVHAAGNHLYGCLATVLHDGAKKTTEQSSSTGFLAKWVEWTGDGTRRKAAIGVGFEGQFFATWPIGTNKTGAPWIRTPDMPPGWCVTPVGLERGDSVTNITATTFDVVGQEMNASGVHYVCLVMRDDGNGVGGRVLGSGAWVGPSRTELFQFPEGDFSPDLLFAVRQLASSGTFLRHKNMAADTSYRVDTSTAADVQAIKSIDANGVTTGTSSVLGALGSPTHWWGLKMTAAAEAAGFVDGQVAGQEADAVIQMEAGLAPYAAFVRGSGATTMLFRLAESEFSGTNCADYDGGVIGSSGGVIAMSQVGGNFTLDGNGPNLDLTPSPIDAFYLGFTQDITVLPPAAADDAYDTAYRTALVVAAPGILTNDDANGGGALSAELVDDVEDGILALASDGSFTYTPPHGFDGTVTFTYRAVNSGTSAIATVTITVAPTHVPIPTEVGLLFIRIMIAGTAYMLAETELADDPSWHYGFKPAQLLAVSDISRELSRDGYRTQSWSFEIADVDRQWRGLSRTHTIEGAYVALYSVDDDVRRAEGAPYRLAGGFVSIHKGVGGFRYAFTVEDVLGRRLADWMAQPTLPPKRLSLVEFPGMDPANDGKPAPIGYGALSDGDEDVPQGVVPALLMGTINLSAIGGIDLVVDAYILVAHAVGDIDDLYYNPQTWAGEIVVEVGDVVRPTPSNFNGHLFRATVAGTAAGTEPTWPTSGTVVDGGVTWEDAGTDDPLLRYVVPDGAFGTVLVCPHKPLWSAATNLAVQYVDYHGVRYTPLFVLHSHRLAKAAREGRVVITANLDGFDTVGDGTGTTLVYPEDVLEHLLANYTFGTWVTGAPLPIGDIDDVAILDGAALAAAKAISVARGYQVAFLVGADGNQEPVFDVIGGLLEGTGLEMGANRHGQLLVSREDELAPAAVTYDATLDTVDDQFDTEPDRETRCNRVEHVYARRYVALNAPTPTPAAGEPLPTKTLPPSAEWASGLTVVEDPVAQAAVGRVITRTLDNHVVRDPATAGDVAARALAQGVGIGRGTALAQDGSKIVTFMTGFQGLSKDGVEVELGTVIGIEHPEGLSAIGWPPGAPARVRVRHIRIAPIAHTVTLSGRLLGWTPPAGSEEEVEEMAFFRGELGGSREVPLPLAGAVANAPSWKDVTIPNLSAAAIANARAKVECRTVNAATSITLELWNVTDETVDFTFDPCTATDVEYEGANQRQDKAVVVVVGKTYRLRGTPSNGTHPTFAADGVLELYG